MSNGDGCECAAYGECECACGADWTDQRVYDLQYEGIILRKALADLLDDCYKFNGGETCFLTAEVMKRADEVLKKIKRV